MRETSLEDVLKFIVDNGDNKELMDKINKISFPFTSKFEHFARNRVPLPKKEEVVLSRNQS